MFKGDKYVTRGVNERIDVRLQLVLWEMIELLRSKGIKLDYLQIFRISNRDGKIIIEHIQEVSEYRLEYSLELKDIKFESDYMIYVIDSEIYSTMLLVEEY